MSSSPALRRVGLFGGTFDPPHVGHLIVAVEALAELVLDEVRLLVAGDPWMKATASPPRHRTRMAELATAEHDRLVVDDRETRRDGPTYTAETLEQLAAEEPDVEWSFLLGADAVAKLDQWHRVEDAVAGARFVALTRPGYPLELEGPLYEGIERLEVPPIAISSTELRRRVGRGAPITYQVPRSVERYIEVHDLYRSGHHEP